EQPRMSYCLSRHCWSAAKQCNKQLLSKYSFSGALMPRPQSAFWPRWGNGSRFDLACQISMPFGLLRNWRRLQYLIFTMALKPRSFGPSKFEWSYAACFLHLGVG